MAPLLLHLRMIQNAFSLCFFFSGKYSEALTNYKRGLAAANSNEHVRLCQFGIARTNIKIGDYKKGVRLIELRVFVCSVQTIESIHSIRR